MAKRLAVTIDNRQEELSHLTRLMEVFLEPLALPTRIVYAVNLVLEEILVNIIRYAYEDDDAHEIVVSLEIGEGELLMAVEDDGKEFNPLAVEAPDRRAPDADRVENGLGLQFVRHVRNAMEYRRENGRNRLKVWIFE